MMLNHTIGGVSVFIILTLRKWICLELVFDNADSFERHIQNHMNPAISAVERIKWATHGDLLAASKLYMVNLYIRI